MKILAKLVDDGYKVLATSLCKKLSKGGRVYIPKEHIEKVIDQKFVIIEKNGHIIICQEEK